LNCSSRDLATLAPEGWLIVEHGAGRVENLEAIFHMAGLVTGAAEQDLSGRARIFSNSFWRRSAAVSAASSDGVSPL
jgi:methylase of polypeptide subunit release factors